MIKHFLHYFSHFLFSIFKIIPLKNIIIFESVPFNSDNTKLIFEAIRKDPFFNEYEIIWIRNTKRDKLCVDNVKYITYDSTTLFKKIKSEILLNYNLAICKFYVYSHQNYSRISPRDSQCFFNLTHGISFKDTRGLYPDPSRSTYISVLSDFTKKLRAQSYNGGIEKMVITGFPRNDLLIQNHRLNTKFLNHGKKTVVWLPTFRRQKNTNRNDTGTTSTNDLPILNSKEDFKRLNQILYNLEFSLIIKPHPAQDITFLEIHQLSNIAFISESDLEKNNIHLYDYLSASCALITDYSSVYIDYLLTEKPIGFTINDINAYKKNKGFMVDDPLKYMPGPKIGNLDELINFFVHFNNHADFYKDQRLKLKNLMHSYQDDNSTQRIIKILKEA